MMFVIGTKPGCFRRWTRAKTRGMTNSCNNDILWHYTERLLRQVYMFILFKLPHRPSTYVRRLLKPNRLRTDFGREIENWTCWESIQSSWLQNWKLGSRLPTHNSSCVNWLLGDSLMHHPLVFSSTCILRCIKVCVVQLANEDCCCRQLYSSCGFWTNSLLAVPIRSGARVLGVMLMVNRGKNEVFTDRDKTSVEVSSFLAQPLNILAFSNT